MRVFLTGATGFIGSRIVPELLARGHEVIGLTRSEAGVESLKAAGAEPYRGTLDDPESLRAGAEASDAVIHTAFDHDFSNFVANCEKDRRVIEVLGDALKGSNRPLLITSGTGMGSTGQGVIAKEDVFAPHPNPRIASEQAGNALLEAGVNVSVMRLPQVHNPERQGLISPFVMACKAKGSVGYLGEGLNRWPAAHVNDVARLYVLAIEKAQPGARYNAVDEEGIPVVEIARTLAEGLGMPLKSLTPDEVQDHFGWLSMFIGMDMPASSAITRAALNWTPTGPSMIEDLKAMDYSAIPG